MSTYEEAFGPIPKPLVIDHLCRVRRCVNPAHMEVVLITTNVMRGEGAPARHARKTHCKNGHAFTAETTRVDSHGHRACRPCDAAAAARYYTRRKASMD